MKLRDMAGADHMAAAERAFDRDEGRYQATLDGPDRDEPPHPADESLCSWVDERLAFYAENLSADEVVGVDGEWERAA